MGSELFSGHNMVHDDRSLPSAQGTAQDSGPKSLATNGPQNADVSLSISATRHLRTRWRLFLVVYWSVRAV